MSDPMDGNFFEPRMPQQRGPRPVLRFFTEAIEFPGRSAEEGRPVYVDKDFVGITNPGSRDEVVRKAEEKAKEDEYIGWAYKKWKSTQEQPVDGTPIDTVPFLSKAQIMELKGINVLTLEALAELPDTAKQRLMGSVEWQKKAKAYMAAAKDGAVVTKMAADIAQRDQTIAMMKKQMDDMSARFDELARKVSA